MATGDFDLRPPLPPYEQLILEAIDELKQKEGANKSAISKYIESKYGDLAAPGHANLLTATLFAMKEKGKLIFLKNNYLRPDPNNPVRRGRGRPPKPKDPLAPSVVATGPSKGRGGPKKDPNAPPAPKKPKADPSPLVGVGEAPAVSKTGQPRGRPRKVKPQAMQNGVGIEGM